MTTIAGEVRFSSAGSQADGAPLSVRVEDASETDAPARTIAAVRIEGVRSTMGAGPIPFRLDAELHEGRRYLLRAHLDVDGDGAVSRGDFVTMQSYPVERGSVQRYTLLLHEVR